MAWTFDPPAPPVVRDVEASRDPETGHARARITLTPWDARAKLRYMDLAARLGFERDPETGREYTKPATLGVICAAITITSAEGFPNLTRQGEDGREVSERFDPSRIDHLLRLPADVLDELRRHALDIQPLPGSAADARRKATPAAPDGEEDLDADPTRTPSTPRARSSASAAQGSARRTRTSTPTS